jgi:hypothetical protein
VHDLGRLFIPFPGFDTSAGFRSTLVWDSRLERQIRDRAMASGRQFRIRVCITNVIR